MARRLEDIPRDDLDRTCMVWAHRYAELALICFI